MTKRILHIITLISKALEWRTKICFNVVLEKIIVATTNFYFIPYVHKWKNSGDGHTTNKFEVNTIFIPYIVSNLLHFDPLLAKNKTQNDTLSNKPTSSTVYATIIDVLRRLLRLCVWSLCDQVNNFFAEQNNERPLRYATAAAAAAGSIN